MVAHFKDDFLPLSETFIYTLLKGMRRYRAIVIDRRERQNPQQFPFDHYYSPVEAVGKWYGVVERLALRYFGRSPYLEGVIKQEKAGIIHAHFGQLGALIAPVARLLSLPLVVSFYGQDLSIFAGHEAWQQRFQLLWREVHTVLALGPNMVHDLQRAGCPAQKITVLPVAVDLQRFRYIERKPPATGETVSLLTVGRLVDKKGVDVILRALPLLSKNFEVRLSIAGEGPQRAALESLAQQLGVAGMTTFLGWIEHEALAAEMSNAHLFVLASRDDRRTGETEGTPAVLLEAQASGLPVISTFHAGIADIIDDDRSGWLVPVDDPHALAKQLDVVIRRRAEWARFSRNARAYVENNHSQNVIAARLENIYDVCLGRT